MVSMMQSLDGPVGSEGAADNLYVSPCGEKRQFCKTFFPRFFTGTNTCGLQQKVAFVFF